MVPSWACGRRLETPADELTVGALQSQQVNSNKYSETMQQVNRYFCYTLMVGQLRP